MHAMISEIATSNGREIRALSDAETETVNGGTFEITVLGVTLQVNADSGCFAVWYGKEFVGGACVKK
jgi:hypothetical protein